MYKTETGQAPYSDLETEEDHSGRLAVLAPTPQSLRRTSAPETNKKSFKHNDGHCRVSDYWDVPHAPGINPALTALFSKLQVSLKYWTLELLNTGIQVKNFL